MATAPEPDLQWTDRLLLGYAPMDDEHRDFVVCVRALQQAAPEQVLARLDDFAVHAERHFGAENRWMEETEFPARQCHIDEHAAVMKSVAEVRAVVAAGNTGIVRSLADELARWFPGHADYLDSALAAWMAKRRWNAKPVIIRRGILDKTPDTQS
jgi:hemerythrin